MKSVHTGQSKGKDMFPGNKKSLLVLLFLSTYLAGQTPASKSSNAQPADQLIASTHSTHDIMITAELQLPKGVIFARVMNGLNNQVKTHVQPAAFAPYKRAFNAMFMWTSTQNFVARFTDNSGTIGNSDIYDSSGLVGIGTTNPQATLHVAGNDTPGFLVEAQDSILFGTNVCCGAGPTGSSMGASGGWSSFYNGVFLNSNGTATGGSGGAQMNTTVPSWRMALGSGSSEWPGGDNFVIGRVAAGGSYGSPSILFSLANNGRMKVAGGVDNTGTGIKHARFQGCTIAVNTLSCTSTVQWSGTFADANYTLVCTSANGFNVGFSNKTSTSVAITVISIAGVSGNTATGEIDCMAMHD